MKKIVVSILTLAVFLIGISFSGFVGIQDSEAARIKTKTACGSAKKQYKSYNRTLRKQIKALKKAHNRVFKVSSNRIVGYTEQIVSSVNAVHSTSKKLKAQANLIQRHCVKNRTMAEPLI